MLGPAAQGYRDRAKDILADAHRLLAAIDDRDAAARGANGAPDGPPLVDAGGLVARVIGRYRGLSRERGVELIGSIAIGLPADRKSTSLNFNHSCPYRMTSSARTKRHTIYVTRDN